jgi:hypothetical protein
MPAAIHHLIPLHCDYWFGVANLSGTALEGFAEEEELY